VRQGSATYYAGGQDHALFVYFAAGGGAGTYTTSNPGENAFWTKVE